MPASRVSRRIGTTISSHGVRHTGRLVDHIRQGVDGGNRSRRPTKVLAGDPAKAGFYTIMLFVPAHTTIPAHSHRDDRMATVVSGTWQFGYGDRFDEGALKQLPAGSVYSEPGSVNHFARTGAEPILVQISGVGPTDTRYFDPADVPKKAASH